MCNEVSILNELKVCDNQAYQRQKLINHYLFIVRNTWDFKNHTTIITELLGMLAFKRL